MTVMASPVTSSTLTLVRLKALANDIRYDVVALLALGERCVCDLEAELDLPQSKVSYHLAVLRDAGLVDSEQRGKNSYYRLRREALYALGGDVLQELLLHDGRPVPAVKPRC